jgi:hypothetical protein
MGVGCGHPVFAVATGSLRLHLAPTSLGVGPRTDDSKPIAYPLSAVVVSPAKQAHFHAARAGEWIVKTFIMERVYGYNFDPHTSRRGRCTTAKPASLRPFRTNGTIRESSSTNNRRALLRFLFCYSAGHSPSLCLPARLAVTLGFLPRVCPAREGLARPTLPNAYVERSLRSCYSAVTGPPPIGLKPLEKALYSA